MWDVRKNLIEVAVARSCTMKQSGESIESGWISSGAPPGNETVNNPSVFGITLAGSIRRGIYDWNIWVATPSIPNHSFSKKFRDCLGKTAKASCQRVNGFGWRDLQEWGMRQSANGRRALSQEHHGAASCHVFVCAGLWFCMISRIIALNLSFRVSFFSFGDTLSIFIRFNLYTVYRFIICILEAEGFGPESRHTQRPSRDLEWVIQKLLIPDRQFPLSITLWRFDIAAHSYGKHDLWWFMMIYPLKNGLFLMIFLIFLQPKRSKREGLRASSAGSERPSTADGWVLVQLATLLRDSNTDGSVNGGLTSHLINKLINYIYISIYYGNCSMEIDGTRWSASEFGVVPYWSLLSDEPTSHFLNFQSSPNPQCAENHCISRVQKTMNNVGKRYFMLLLFDVVFAVC